MMPIPLIALLVAAGLLAQTPPAASQSTAKRGRISGRVQNALTGEALRKATVSLIPSADGRQGVSTTTGASGEFTFENVEPGSYSMVAEKTGFLRASLGGRGASSFASKVTVSEGGETSGVTLRLMPHGILSGRVLDEDSDPAEGASVVLYRNQYLNGNRRWVAAAQANSNDRGEYRIANIPPGKYVLAVQWQGLRTYTQRGPMGPPGGGRNGQTRTPVADQKPEEFGYPRLFFPGVEEMPQAQLIGVAAGQELSGIELRLRKSRIFKIRGRFAGAISPAGAANAGGGGRVRYSVQMRGLGTTGGADLGGMRGMSPGSGVRPNDGTFEISSVFPGRYRLFVSDFTSNRPRVIGFADVSVGAADVDGVEIAPVSSLTLNGQVVVEGDTAAVNLKSLRLQLLGADGTVGPNTAVEIRDDGSFQIKDLSPERWRLSLQTGSAAIYWKNALLGGRNVRNEVVDFSTGGAVQMIVTVSTKVASIAGLVEREKPEDAAGSVVIVRADADFSPVNPGLSPAPATVDATGKFTIGNLGPGEYRLFAFEDIDGNSAADPDFLRRFENRSVTVRIGEAETKAVSLKQVRASETTGGAAQ